MYWWYNISTSLINIQVRVQGLQEKCCKAEQDCFGVLTSFNFKPLTVGADEEISLTETERIRLLADYIQETERFDL